MFRAIKSHVTGSYHGKLRHGILILNTSKTKRIRKYDGTHVNIASSVNRFSKQDMAGTTISRHVGELVPLTTEQYMAWQGNQQ